MGVYIIKKKTNILKVFKFMAPYKIKLCSAFIVNKKLLNQRIL